MGPTVWMISEEGREGELREEGEDRTRRRKKVDSDSLLAGKRWPDVILASPVLHPPSVSHSFSSDGPAAECMAPSTPPPPSRVLLAAFTMASISSRVMSPCQRETLELNNESCGYSSSPSSLLGGRPSSSRERERETKCKREEDKWGGEQTCLGAGLSPSEDL